jgi:hypothetical protein
MAGARLALWSRTAGATIQDGRRIWSFGRYWRSGASNGSGAFVAIVLAELELTERSS